MKIFIFKVTWYLYLADLRLWCPLQIHWIALILFLSKIIAIIKYVLLIVTYGRSTTSQHTTTTAGMRDVWRAPRTAARPPPHCESSYYGLRGLCRDPFYVYGSKVCLHCFAYADSRTLRNRHSGRRWEPLPFLVFLKFLLNLNIYLYTFYLDTRHDTVGGSILEP